MSQSRRSASGPKGQGARSRRGRASAKLGPTHDFPEGKLNPTDEGAITLAIAHDQGKVLINFGKPVAWVGMSPHDADGLADLLKQHARAARLEPSIPGRWEPFRE